MAVRSANPGIGGVCRALDSGAIRTSQPLRAGRAGDKRRRMTEPAPAAPGLPARLTVEQYFALVDQGVLEENDNVELLEGVVVAMASENLWHANGVRLAYEALRTAVGDRAFVDQQHGFIAGSMSVPEPDVTVLPGKLTDYFTHHPSQAHLV